jgi:hypothetical protein
MKQNNTANQPRRKALRLLTRYLLEEGGIDAHDCTYDGAFAQTLEALTRSSVSVIRDLHDQTQIHIMVAWSPEYDGLVPNHLEHFVIQGDEVSRVAMGFKYRFTESE